MVPVIQAGSLAHHVGLAGSGDAKEAGGGGAAQRGGGAPAEGQHHEVGRAGGEGELALVVEHVRERHGRRVGDSGGGSTRAGARGPRRGAQPGAPVQRRHLGGAHAAGGRAHLPQREVERVGLHGVGAGEHERRRARHVVARDQQRLRGVAHRQVAEHLPERGLGAGPTERRHQSPAATAGQDLAVLGHELARRLGGHPAREQRRREEPACAGAGGEVEEVRDARGGVAGELLQAALEADQRGGGERAAVGAPVDGEHADAARGGRDALQRRQRAEQEVGLEDGEYLLAQAVGAAAVVRRHRRR